MTGTAVRDTFHAWLNKMPISPHTLHVIGAVRFPTGGWTVSLVPAVPQGINPTILILDVVGHPPSGPVIQVPSCAPAVYQLTPGDAFRQVTIRDDSGEFTIDVEIVV